MTRDDTKSVIKLICNLYPAFKITDPQGVVDAWHLVLKDYGFDQIKDALAKYSKTNKYAPSVGDITSQIKQTEYMAHSYSSDFYRQLEKECCL